MVDKKIQKISDKAAAWLAGWWFSDTVSRGLGDPTAAQQREFERQVQQSMRQKTRSSRRTGLRKMGPYMQTEKNDTYFRKIPVENAVQATLVKYAIGSQRLSVPPFQGARFDPTSHRWVKPENMANTVAARGGKKRVRGSGPGTQGSRSIGGHGKGHERFNRRSIRGREAAKDRRQDLIERVKRHTSLENRRNGRVRKSTDQIAMEEYYFLLKDTNEAKEFAAYSKAAFHPDAIQAQRVEHYNLQKNPHLIKPGHIAGAHNDRYQAVVDAFWNVHKSKRGMEAAATPQELRNAKKTHVDNVSKLQNATYSFNSGKFGSRLENNQENHTYNHTRHEIGSAPFANHYNTHIRNLPQGAVYASSYPPPKGVKTYETPHGAAYWLPDKLGHNSNDQHTKAVEGQTLVHEQGEGRKRRQEAEKNLDYETYKIPQRAQNEKDLDAFRIGIKEARENSQNPLVINRGKYNEYTYYGQTDLFPLQEDIDSGETNLNYIRAPHGPGLVKYRSGNIASGIWRKGELLNGSHAVNPTNRKTGGPGIGNDRTTHEQATINSKLTGLGDLANNPLASNVPTDIMSKIVNLSPAEQRRLLSGIKTKIDESDINLSQDINKEYNPFIGLDILMKTHRKKFKKS